MATKTPAEDLFKEIVDDLIIYLQQGKISITPFLERLKLNIENLDYLLDIHFILLPEVIDFVIELSALLRKIKVSSSSKREMTQDNIRGPIDYNYTLQSRHRTNFIDKICMFTERQVKILTVKKILF